MRGALHFKPMNWLNLPIATIRRPEYVGSDPVHRATWLNLMVWCAEQENGGIIAGCADWKCRRWQQTCGVTLAEVQDACDLWHIDAHGLTLWGYPSEKEKEVASKRSGGSKGGSARAENARLEAERQAELEAMLEAELQRKGKEWKGIGMEVIPPNPQRGEDGEDSNRCLPKGWKRLSTTERKNTKVNHNTPSMDQIGGWFRRKPGNLWTVHEAAALLTINPEPAAIAGMGRYYLADIEPEKDIRRRDLQTLLNNWSGELDRARAWAAKGL